MTFRRSFTAGSIVVCLLGAACSSSVTEYHDSNSSAGTSVAQTNSSAAGSIHSDKTTAENLGGIGAVGATTLSGKGGGAQTRGSGGTVQTTPPNSSSNASSGGSTSSIVPPVAGGAVNNTTSTASSGGAGTGGSHAGGTSNLGGSTATVTALGGSTIGGSYSTASSIAAGMSNVAGRSGATGGASGGTHAIGGTSPTGGRTSTAGASGSALAGYSGVAGAAPNCDPLKPFGTLRQVVPNTAVSSENSMTVAIDGLSAIIAVRSDVNNATTSFDLRRYTRASINDVFGSPVNILGSSNINTTSDEYQPRLTQDRLNLYFTRASSTKSEILVATRAIESDDFPAATPLVATVNLSDSVGYAFKSLSAGYFYWIANEKLQRATLTGNDFTDLLVPERLNSIGNVSAPALTDDELTIYLASKGDGATAYAYQQIWRATRASASPMWNTPAVVTELIDNATDSSPVDVSADGCSIYVAKKLNSAYRLYQASKPR